MLELECPAEENESRREEERRQNNNRVVQEALRRIGIHFNLIPVKFSEEASVRDTDHDEPGEGQEKEGTHDDYMDEITEAEHDNFQEMGERLVQRGQVPRELAKQMMRTAPTVSLGRRCAAATLDEAELEPTESLARMDVVV